MATIYEAFEAYEVICACHHAKNDSWIMSFNPYNYLTITEQ